VTTPPWNGSTPPEPNWGPPTPPPMPPGQPPNFYDQPGQQPGQPWGSGVQPMAQPMPGNTLVTIGDIVCTQTEVITPSGRCPVGQVTWSFTDMSRTTRAIPTWAIVCAVIFFFFCLLGLLFLLAKEERTEGTVQVVVQGPGLLHQVQLPVTSVMQVQDYNARVSYARSLSASAGMGGY